jgi:hypothetical protein
MMESSDAQPDMGRPAKGNALNEIMAQIGEFSQGRLVRTAFQTVPFPPVMPTFLAAKALPTALASPRSG